MGSNAIIIERQENIGIITINRPEVRNALDKQTWADLCDAFVELEADANIAVIIVTGAGDKAFVAGADLNALKARTGVETLSGETPAIVSRIEQVTKPTIAAINGFVFGGGLELAMVCDIRICSRQAKLGQTEINVGILPGAGGTQRLTRLVGLAKAKELIFTGKIIDAEQAEKIGLVNQVVEHDQLMDATLDMARNIATKSPLTLKIAKLAVNQGLNADLATGLVLERLGQSFIFASEDRMEGINAFLEKRQPNFKGR